MHFLYFEVTGPLCSPASLLQMLTSACSALSISALLLQGFPMSFQTSVSACAARAVPNSITAAMIERFIVRSPDTYLEGRSQPTGREFDLYRLRFGNDLIKGRAAAI
jgi:hypothetical protein